MNLPQFMITLVTFSNSVLFLELKTFGFVSLAERNNINNEHIFDWTQKNSDLKLVIPLDRLIIMNDQSLLQMQGYGLYPDTRLFFNTYSITMEYFRLESSCDSR